MTKSDGSSGVVSNTGSDYTHRSRRMQRYWNPADDMRMPPTSVTNTDDFHFVTCTTPGCSTSSAFSEYNAMTLRAGYDTCTTHTTIDMVKDRIATTCIADNTLFVFYDIEFTRTNEIEQVAAVTAQGDEFNEVIRTTTRGITNPITSKLPPSIYMILAREPRVAMDNLVSWVTQVLNRVTGGQGTASDVVMVAHNGMCHDHVMLIKTMMQWGMVPPKWRFSDTLPIFKVVLRPSERSNLSTLAYTYIPWFVHTEHDGFSDALALKNIIVTSIPGWQTACYVFSVSSRFLITSVGLNTFRVRDPLPFPDMPRRTRQSSS